MGLVGKSISLIWWNGTIDSAGKSFRYKDRNVFNTFTPSLSCKASLAADNRRCSVIGELNMRLETALNKSDEKTEFDDKSWKSFASLSGSQIIK